jgi:hypothetical protein
MTTALDLIQDSLEMLGVYGPGDAISSADSSRSLIVLNDMLDSWSNESLTCFAWLQQQFALAVNVTQYTCGPGGTVSNVRPLRVSDSAGSAYILDQNNNKYPMDVVDQLTYNLRTTAAVNSNLPDTLFYDPQFPLGIVNIWPTPSEIFEVYFFSYLQLAEFATIYTNVSLPPGYNLAIKTNLAVALKPYFTSAQLDPVIIKRAAESLGNVKRNNNRTQRSIYEPEIIARGQSTYNIRSDRNY